MTNTLTGLLALNLSVLVVPGVNFLTIVRNSLFSGRKAGFLTAAGASCAILLHVFIAIFFSQALMQHQHVFEALKYFAFIYLLFLAWNFLKSAMNKKSEMTPLENQIASSEKNSFIRFFKMGILIDCFNPYVAIFYLSAFATMESIDLGSKLSYSIWIFLLTIGWFSGVGFFFSFPKIRNTFFKYRRSMEFCASVAIAYFAIQLLV